MVITVRAVYEGGVLRPLQQLTLDDGETVEVTVVKTDGSTRNATITETLSSARTIADWVDATKLLPSDDGGYDIVRALNDNRIWSGEAPLLPDDGSRT